MSASHNTVFLKLEGPMQSWGTSSRLQLRRTDLHPSRSGVMGMLLCAMGISRANSRKVLAELSSLSFGVRVDQKGTLDWDYHTAGAGIGIRQAENGKPKLTASTGEFETLLSRRQYIFDGSFLAAFRGSPELIDKCVRALEDPVWPFYLGRKSCIPATPVFAGTGSYPSILEALADFPWERRNSRNYRQEIELDTFIDNSIGSIPPEEAKIVHDVPAVFGFFSHKSRWVVPHKVIVSSIKPMPNVSQSASKWNKNSNYYSSENWKKKRQLRLEHDKDLCVFCKSTAREVHHVTYDHFGNENLEDLRSLCKLCHEACTILEYSHSSITNKRIDPSDPTLRETMLQQIRLLIGKEQSPKNKIEESEVAQCISPC